MVCRTGHEQDPLERMRHSSAHVLADAVQQLFPEAKVTIGPVIDEGFYYDFDYAPGFTPEDLPKIEKRMTKIIKRNLPFAHRSVPKTEAHALFADRGETYKLEILEGIPEESVGLFTHGEFTDLCKGPHVERTGDIKAFKLLKISGAYWRGDEKNPMLQRIYGTAFATQDELDAYLANIAEAERRDHRRLGPALGLFSTMDQYGAGLILWHPRGSRVRQVIEDYWRDAHRQGGYELVYSPHIARLDLWKESGHWDFYRESMFAPIDVDGVEYELKPMNCPFHIQIFAKGTTSYRQLPIRLAELGTVYRYERSGVLHGLLRVRGFTQDDAHIFCTPEQLQDEIATVLTFVLEMLATFGFTDYDVFLSTKPEKYVGADDLWDQATAALEGALKTRGVAYAVDPGEGVFYGPKIDVKIRDVLGRAWQCSTIQVDFNLPERYNISYTGADGAKHRPIMVHRALLGSLERFFGILIEQYEGAFPLWLAPVQVQIIPITDAQREAAQQAASTFLAAGLRVEVDDSDDKLGAKIRAAQMAKVPYMAVIGKREAAGNQVALRSRVDGDLGAMDIDACVERLQQSVATKQ
jgi:threonyl-tRNA synthetase